MKVTKEFKGYKSIFQVKISFWAMFIFLFSEKELSSKAAFVTFEGEIKYQNKK